MAMDWVVNEVESQPPGRSFSILSRIGFSQKAGNHLSGRCSNAYPLPVRGRE